MDEPLNSSTEAETTISEAFKSPSADAIPQRNDGIRLEIRKDEPLQVRQIRPTGFSAVWGFLFPNATVVELSGKFNLTLNIYPSHVQIEKRRWMSRTSVLARFKISIPLYNQIGDEPAHQLVVRCTLAFFYPFVPMHVLVAVDEDVVFCQGKFDVD